MLPCAQLSQDYPKNSTLFPAAFHYRSDSFGLTSCPLTRLHALAGLLTFAGVLSNLLRAKWVWSQREEVRYPVYSPRSSKASLLWMKQLPQLKESISATGHEGTTWCNYLSAHKQTSASLLKLFSDRQTVKQIWPLACNGCITPRQGHSWPRYCDTPAPIGGVGSLPGADCFCFCSLCQVPEWTKCSSREKRKEKKVEKPFYSDSEGESGPTESADSGELAVLGAYIQFKHPSP